MDSEDSSPNWSRASSMDCDDWSFQISNSRLGYKVLTSNDVVNQMNDEIDSISESMQLAPTIVRILFDRYKWDKQVMMEKYFACACDNDKEAFFRDARIINPLKYKAHTGGYTTSAVCEICYETTAVTGLQCGHTFCDLCWSTYLTLRINDSSKSTIPCAHSKCDIIIEDVIVRKFVTDPDVISKYNRLICNHFVQWKRDLHWCPSPGCSYVIETQNDCRYVTCLCKTQFCCECYEQWHAPISCRLLDKWKKDDSATQDYLATNTKACPKCQWSIEKNGGCPHMTCKNCSHEFCWKCLRPWKIHDGSYKCMSPAETEAIQKSRSLIERMKCCWDRYVYNRNALRDERQRYDLDWGETLPYISDMKERVRVLYECRRFLMHSYAFIFYLEEDNRVYLLESNLDDLEAKTDRLTVALEIFFLPDSEAEEPLSNREEIRAKIIDIAVHCDRLRETWQSDIEKQCDEGSWRYRDGFQE